MTLTNEEKEEVKEIYDWGYFMNGVIKYNQDAGSNELSEEDILLLIEAEDNLELFSNYKHESSSCEMCGSHGKVSVNIAEKTFVIKEW